MTLGGVGDGLKLGFQGYPMYSGLGVPDVE